MATSGRDAGDQPRTVTLRAALAVGLFAVVMTAMLTWGLATGAYGWQPGALGSARGLQRQPEFGNLVSALNLIQTQYVKKPDMKGVLAAAINGATSSLGDPYSTYLPPQAYAELTSTASGRYTGIGIQVDASASGAATVVHVFPGSPAATTPYVGGPTGAGAGLRPGDRLVAVDGRSLAGKTLPQVAALIAGPAGTAVTVEVARDAGGGARSLTFRLVRRQVTMYSVEAAIFSDRIGYLAINAFSAQTPAEVEAALRALRADHMRGLVLDLRNNPGGVLESAIAVGKYFLPAGVVTYLVARSGPRQEFTLRATSRISVPYVVLVNGFTASAAEVLAGAIQDRHAALLVGERTFGKGIVQRVFALRGGAGLRLTVAHYYTPDGRDLNGRGLEPNVVIPEAGAPASAYGNPAQDPQLAAALLILSRGGQMGGEAASAGPLGGPSASR